MDEYIMVVGTANIDCNFSFQVALYDTEKKYDNLGDDSLANETVLFYVP